MWRGCCFLLWLSACAAAHADDSCPWLTQGTAAALLGGAVEATAHVARGEGSCRFALPTHPRSLLTIDVRQRPPHACLKGEPLTGIGQDAVLCTSDAGANYREMIRGRVRARYFLLTLSAQGAGAGDRKKWLRHSLEHAAEEVAGNLF